MAIIPAGSGSFRRLRRDSMLLPQTAMDISNHSSNTDIHFAPSSGGFLVPRLAELKRRLDTSRPHHLTPCPSSVVGGCPRSPRTLTRIPSPRALISTSTMRSAVKPLTFPISWIVLSIFASVCILGGMLAFATQISLNRSLQLKIDELEQVRDELTWSKGLLNNEMRTSISVTDANMLREEATHLQQILEQEKSPFSTTEISLKESEEKLQQEIRHHHHDVVILQRTVSTLASLHTVETFGQSDKYYVHFTVKLPGSINKRTFVAEMAPLTSLPATVNNFLQQVHQGLWDRTAFHVNAKHVIMAHPFETVEEELPKRHLFEEKGLAELPYLEYSKEFPHSKYTLGLNGNPIGPDFYINKMDNSEIHGHGGHQLGGYAEPCFAKIILGWEVIDDMANLQGSMVLEGLLDEPIQILRAKVLTSLEKL